tara:strand:+ start:2894 stop:3250 length:357 start_codon:yes stop_codon:yes gene_type:complete
MVTRKFIRRDSGRFSKIGKNRKKLQKWRRPTGRDNKIREKRKGYPKGVRIGFKTAKKESGKINGLIPLRIENVGELERAEKNNLIIIGKVGAKKKIELIKKANDMKFKVMNVKVGGKA